MKIVNGKRFYTFELSEENLSIVLQFLERGAYGQVKPIFDAINAQLPQNKAGLTTIQGALPEGSDYDRIGGSSLPLSRES